MEIKRADGQDIAAVTALVSEVFMQFEAPDYSSEGIKAFFDTAIYNKEYMDSLVIYIAYSESGEQIGVIATRNNGSHIALFFVRGVYQRQGVGRKLFETVLSAATGKITVNSSPYAKEIYRRLGFEVTDVEQNVGGIRFVPMARAVK